MQKKITTYENVELSKELKNKCIKYIQDNPIEIYFDYNDKLSLENVEKLMENEEKYNELENEIYEYNLDYIYDMKSELMDNLKKEYEELEDFDICDLKEEFLDYINVNMDIKQLLKNTPDVRIRVVIHSNYEGVNYAERSTGDFKGVEYIRDIKKILRGKYDVQSFQQELDNICSCTNQFIFYMKCDVESLIGIKEKFKNKITIPKNSWGGFYDSWNGSGSVLEVKFLKDITIKKQYGETEYDTVDIVLDENNKYSVENVYGLCNVPECTLKVK